MGKSVYKLLDQKGRVLIPKEMRNAAGMEYGDIVGLGLQDGKVSVRKVSIVEVGVSDGELRETQTANYFSNLYPIDCAVPSVNA